MRCYNSLHFLGFPRINKFLVVIPDCLKCARGMPTSNVEWSPQVSATDGAPETVVSTCVCVCARVSTL